MHPLKFQCWQCHSDALETIINVVAACTALVALRISARPADADHPYGHQKAEYFSAVLEGMMVLGAAAAILHEVYGDWRHPTPVEAPLLGMAINGVATLLNGAWATFLIRSGRAWRSPADRSHEHRPARRYEGSVPAAHIHQEGQITPKDQMHG